MLGQKKNFLILGQKMLDSGLQVITMEGCEDDSLRIKYACGREVNPVAFLDEKPVKGFYHLTNC